jgi:capsular polysaccharide transport system permease protein
MPGGSSHRAIRGRSPGVPAGKTRILAALMIRETAARFGRSWGGYVWAVAEPLGGIVLLSVAFSFVVHSPPLGKSFALFYATGLIPFLLYNAVAGGAMAAPSANRGLLNYPAVTPLDTVVARAGIETLTYCLIAALFLPALVSRVGEHPVIQPEFIALSLALGAALGLGVGAANAAIAQVWPAWRVVWSVINRPLFFLSGVLFPLHSLPDGLAPVIWWNPVTHVIAAMRAGFWGPEQADLAGALYTGSVAAVLFALSGLWMVRNAGQFVQG